MRTLPRLFAHGALLVATLYAVPSFAHDAKEHAAEAQAAKPNCAAIKNMDPSKMDMNDPVMAALHKKCMSATAHAGHGAHDAPGAESNNPAHADGHK